jgi:heme-degrading monooxygenase HmoA
MIAAWRPADARPVATTSPLSRSGLRAGGREFAPMNARITWTQYPPELIDQLEASAKGASAVIEPILRQTPGFRGGYWMADRSNGLMVGLTFWDSMDGIQAYEAATAEMRATVAQGQPQQTIGHYEIYDQILP